MTDPADRHIEDRLHALARGVSVPVVAADQDVRRGRRRLLRIRLALAGGTTATLAVVLGVTGLTAGHPIATELPPATQPATSPPVDPTPSPSEEARGTGRQKTDVDARGGGQQPPATDPTGSAGNTAGAIERVPGVPGSTTGATDPHGSGTAGPGHGHPTLSEPTSAPTSSTATPTSTPTSDPTSTPTSDPTSAPTTDPTATPPPTDPTTTPPPTDPGKIRLPQVLRSFNNVLAEHLDPARAHLQPWDRTTDDKETTRRGGQLFALGSTNRWADGKSLGGVDVTVATGWDQVDWECGDSGSDWACHDATEGTGEVASHDGLLQVAVEQADGQVVVISASRAGLAEADLIAAAVDDRLALPGEAPVAPPRLDGETFASAGVAALVGQGETFTRTATDRSPAVKGTWSVADAARGTLAWSAQPVYSGAGWQCLKAYRSCTDLVIDKDGHVVHVAAVKKRLGGGWVVEYDGPEYAVRVTASDRKFPRKRAYAFVTDGSWQPATS